jgi:hypothetical protein
MDNVGRVIKWWCVWVLLATACAPLLFPRNIPMLVPANTRAEMIEACQQCETDAECEAFCDPLCPGQIYCRGECVTSEEACK